MRLVLVLGLLMIPPIDSSAQSAPDARASAAPDAQEIVPGEPEGVFVPRRASAGMAGTPDPWGLAKLSGTLVYVTTRDGREVLARFFSFTDEELSVTVGGTRRVIALADVKRISLEGDSLRNGALFGLAIGPLVGVLWPCDTCRTHSEQVLSGAMVGAGTGVLVDHLHRGRTTVFPPR